MTLSLLFRREALHRHERVSVFLGPDRDHRALSGTLTMRPDESAAFWDGLMVMQYGLREMAMRRAQLLEEPEPERWQSTELEVEVAVP